MEDFANNIRSLENYVENVKNSIKKPNHLEKEVNEKIELFENRIELLRKAIEEKDMKINILEKQIEKIVKSREKPTFKCQDCEFTSSSEQGLKIHQRKKHNSHDTTETKEDYPRPCELCDKVIQTKQK